MISLPAPRQCLALVCLLLVGALTGVYTSLFSQSWVLVLGVPLLVPLVVLLITHPQSLFLMLLISRCALDPILESSRFSSNVGLGAALNLLVVACAVVWGLQKLSQRQRPAMLLWVAPFAVMVLGTVMAPDTISALKKLVAFLSYGAVFVMGHQLCLDQDQRGLQTLLRVVILSAIVPLTVGMVQYATGNLFLEGRLAATFTHPNIYAFYCLLVVIALLGLQHTEGGDPGIRWALLPLLVASIVLTQTRSAWAALVVAGLLYGLLVSRRVLLWMLVAVSLAAITPAVQDRLMDLLQGNQVVQYAKLNSFAWRQYIWESGLRWMSPSHYWLGYGVGGFKHYSIDFFPMSGGNAFGAHNVYVERFFDGGLLAVSVFAVFIAKQLQKAWQYTRQVRTLGLLYIALIASYLILNFSDNVVDYLAYNWYYWSVAGAFYAMATGTGQGERKAEA
ncbi:MAG TPA: O-antigen ligase family protein [Limnobacter sp.]|uniref:O-antigen ligase family protein n=1 Tax=Limnobacter sp. TaxID=2003368 RepID=UPI002ED8FF82